MALGFLCGAALASCGEPAPTSCSATTCGGCCDATGRCLSGTAVDACGVEGQSCGRCGAGTTCQAGACAVDEGGGDGGSSGCRQIASVSLPASNELLLEYRRFASDTGFYNFALWGVGAGTSPFDAVRVEVVYPDGQSPLTPPLSQSFSAQGYQACLVCMLYQEGCDDTGQCARTYLAQAGSVSISRADRAEAGRIIGSATNVRFNQWNIETDTAVGSACVEVGSIGPWNSGWNADGGEPPP